MDFFDAVTSISPVKKYEKTPVDDKLIGTMLYMANNADSAGSLQGWEFIVVNDPEIKKKLSNAALDVDTVEDAPVDIVVCADLKKFSLKYGERGEYIYSVQETASTITIMMITAQLLGLGTNWVRSFDEEKVKEILTLSNELRPLGIVTVGHPYEKSKRKTLKDFGAFTWSNQFRKKYNLSYLFQLGPKEDVFKPIGNQVMDLIKKRQKKD